MNIGADIMTLLRGLMDLLIGDFINNALIRNMCPLRDLSGTELFSTRVQTLLNHQVFRGAIDSCSGRKKYSKILL